MHTHPTTPEQWKSHTVTDNRHRSPHRRPGKIDSGVNLIAPVPGASEYDRGRHRASRADRVHVSVLLKGGRS